jgi:hypothetical protein
MENGRLDMASVVVLSTFSLILHVAFVYDALVAWGYVGGSTISEATHKLLMDKPGVALLLGYLVCHLVRG